MFRFRRFFGVGLAVGALLLSSLACNALLTPFLPPTPTSTVPALAELPRKGNLRPPTATPTPTATPSPTPVPPTPTPTLDPAALNHPDRPILSGEVEVYGTSHFLIHFTLSGRDAVSLRDDNGNGTPDFVEAVAEALEYSWQVIVEDMGWPAPPSDNGIGGDARYDVYLENIFDDGLAGYTEGGYRSTIVGDNPNTPALETRASHSFIALDNDFQGKNVPALEIMQATAAHELVHAIQYGLDADEPATWLWEATATWMEDEVYDHINSQDYYLDAVFGSTDSCQIAEGREGEDDESHWYAMWIFLRYISERHGSEVIRQLWENLVAQDGYAALETTLEAAGTTLDEVFYGYSVALLTRGFEEGAGYPTPRLKGQVEVGEAFRPERGIDPMALDAVRLAGEGPLQITLDGLEHGLAVGVFGQEAEVFRLRDGAVAVDASRYDYLYLIVLNLSRASRAAECREQFYSIITDAGGEADVPDQVLSVPYFRPPQIRLLPDG